jgi:phosphatidylinositol kinase/protein kinase (PI-3  family)
MGLTGYEGVYRQSLEATMSVLRDNRYACHIFSILVMYGNSCCIVAVTINCFYATTL